MDALYEHSGVLNVASKFEIDDVIDPAETRRLVLATLDSGARNRPPKSRRFIDAW